MTQGLPVDVLEKRAADQRRQLHDSVSQLRNQLREKMDVRGMARPYVWQVSGAAVVLCAALGYGIAGLFRD